MPLQGRQETESKLTYEELKAMFHMSISDAAKTLGLTMSAFKEECRLHHIKRWPYRKMASLTRLLRENEALIRGRGVGGDAAMLAELRQLSQQVLENPNTMIPANIRRFQQVMFMRRSKCARNIVVGDELRQLTI